MPFIGLDMLKSWKISCSQSSAIVPFLCVYGLMLSEINVIIIIIIIIIKFF